MQSITITNPHTAMRLAALLALPEQPRLLLIVCHGFRGAKENGGQIYGFGEQLNAAGIALLTFDFSGSGASEGSFDTMTLSRQASDLKAVIAWARERFKLPLVLLGRSFGGSTVMAGGAEDLAIAGYVFWSAPLCLEETFAAMLPGDYARLKNGRRVEIDYEGDRYALGPELAADLAAIDLDRRVTAIGRRPTLIIHACDDEVVPVANALRLSRHLPQARLHLFEAAGHRFDAHSDERQALTVQWLRATFLSAAPLAEGEAVRAVAGDESPAEGETARAVAGGDSPAEGEAVRVAVRERPGNAVGETARVADDSGDEPGGSCGAASPRGVREERTEESVAPAALYPPVARLERLRQAMAQAELPALLVSSPPNIFYLSGFSGGADGRLLITPQAAYLLTDGRYFEQAARECPHWKVAPVKAGEPDPLFELCSGVKKLGFEAHHLSVAQYNRMTAKISSLLVDFSGAIERMRLLKDEGERSTLRAAAAISDKVWRGMRAEIEAGMSERQIAARIAFRLREEGCASEAFATIAAAGANGALPHAQAGDYRLRSGDLLTCDFGGYYDHYAGDMTRTIAIGELAPHWRERYKRLLEVQERAVSRVRAGASGRELYQLTVQDLARHDLDRYFNHGLGHGLGLEVHESPRLSAASTDVLQANMVVTVEPGIYFPGEGGIRIEDTVIVKNQGCERITHSDKLLAVI